MTVKRIVANIAAADLEPAKRFYGSVFGLDVVMDLGWIVTFAAAGVAAPQISVATEGGSGTPIPDLSVEVDDLAGVHRRAVEAGYTVEYGPLREPWGVTRLYLRDPFGRLVNVLSHVLDGNGRRSTAFPEHDTEQQDGTGVRHTLKHREGPA